MWTEHRIRYFLKHRNEIFSASNLKKSFQSANAAVAVSIGDKMYCFGDFVPPGLNMTGPMDVQIIQAGINMICI